MFSAPCTKSLRKRYIKSIDKSKGTRLIHGENFKVISGGIGGMKNVEAGRHDELIIHNDRHSYMFMLVMRLEGTGCAMDCSARAITREQISTPW